MPGPLRIDYRRILFVVQPHLFSGQYANRRFRGTDHHLVSLVDRARRSLLQGKYGYVISLDAAGAFDNVARRQLALSLKSAGVDRNSRRLILGWLRGRSFIFKHQEKTGTVYDRPALITSGLRQGGVLSSILWLSCFNAVHDGLESLRTERQAEPGIHFDLIYADDVSTVIIGTKLARLQTGPQLMAYPPAQIA